MKTNSYPKSPLTSSFKLAMVILVMIFAAAQAFAQDASTNKGVTGVVKFSEDNEPAPGVNIYLKGSTAKGTYSGANGQFEFPHQLNVGDVLVFSFIGCQTVEYVVHEIPSAIEIIMNPDPIEMVEEVLVEDDALPTSMY